MASPLPPNATLTFQVPGTPSIDELGNLIAPTTTVSFRAYLKGSNERSQDQRGGANNSMILQGRCTDPLVMPAGIFAGSKGHCVLETQVGRMEGDFFLQPSVLSAFEVVDIVLGQKIRGEFIQYTNYGGAA